MGMWEPAWNKFWTPDEFNKYPLVMSSPHSIHRFFSDYDMNPLVGDSTDFDEDPLHKGDVYGNNALKISAVDANTRGIVDGDEVRIFNDSGQVVVRACVTNAISPGMVTLCNGRWVTHDSSTNVDSNGHPIDVRGCPNSLTYSRSDPTAVFPHDAPVQVELFDASPVSFETTSVISNTTTSS